LLVREMRWEADDVLTVTLTRPDGTALPAWELGAHIDMILRPDLIRQYSLCSLPKTTDAWTVGVLLDPVSSGGSKYIHDTLRPGMKVSAVGPRNNFPLVEAEQYLFVAGGIGVTPLLPMVKTLADRHADWRLLYGGRHRNSMAFLGELAAYGDRVRIRPEDEFGLLDLKGALDEVAEDAAIYCCGPEPLIDAVVAQVEAAGRPAAHIERFKGSATEIDTSEDTEFDVIVEKTGERIHIPADKTILQALEEHGVWVATSCTEGYCGACETEVVAGIPDHRDEYLSDEVRASNSIMMICVGRAKTPELVLRFAL
jgi:ferredoxin-NADP reductase